MIGLYIHVPFCEAKCGYCDFYSQKGDNNLYNAYTQKVIATIKEAQQHFKEEINCDTIYFGGGTPTILGGERLGEILATARECFGKSQNEITLEANPITADLDYFSQLKNAGFNRISFGVQSLKDETLKTLGRLHNATQAREAINLAYKAGFSHISADLMLGVPNQTKNEIAQNIAELSQLPIEHVSAYLLKIEENTPFFTRYPEELFLEDELEEFYLFAIQKLLEHGFYQYEISNFAKSKETQAKHNLKYWHCKEYLGIGPSAHSFYKGERFYFNPSLHEFLSAPNSWEQIVKDGEGGSEEERLMLALRLNEGIALADFSNNFAKKLSQKSQQLISGGFLQPTQSGFCLTKKGMLVSNAVITALI